VLGLGGAGPFGVSELAAGMSALLIVFVDRRLSMDGICLGLLERSID